ncbi:uncharacterized protein LOC116299234 [Actinia tenebrosa]|uniref:Uncharacterized protein LOC116299234 n=1 Tax=Actinia tenebrosa TaxID=6105 RepID=A0A6P8ICW7_ACTTE|nr:uncharacterized protein LOC116299234 [Actinia tenebrosa]
MAIGRVVIIVALLYLNLTLLCDAQAMIRARQCTFFGQGRTPKEAYSLSNCTWFKEQSCCRHTEVTSVFQAMMPLETNNKKCYDLMNYLMCYFCSPDQELWYKSNQVHVCGTFCKQIYKNCKSASYKGETIGKKYPNGKKFCEAQLFVVKESNKECFDHSLISASSHSSSEFCLLFILITFSIVRFSLL